jgi:predicted nucleic acid-binding protein
MARSQPHALYVETSAVLRAVVESGTTPDVEDRIREAEVLVTSRLSLVESARALLRMQRLGQEAEGRIADFERDLTSLWRHCHVWELTPTVCDLAERVAPHMSLRTLDALHLATFALARRQIAGLELLTADERLRQAAEGAF